MHRINVPEARSMLRDRATVEDIFGPIRTLNVGTASDRAAVVSAAWLLFSAQMPIFLCRVAGAVSDDTIRANIVVTAYEELGSGSPEARHALAFSESVKMAGVTDDLLQRATQLCGAGEIPSVLDLVFSSDHEAIGICAGLEIPAEENIGALLNTLTHLCPDPSDSSIRESEFFRIHLVNETHHINAVSKLYVDNVDTPGQRAAFLRGFERAIYFWTNYWRRVVAVVEHMAC